MLRHPIFKQVNRNALMAIASLADVWFGWSWEESSTGESSGMEKSPSGMSRDVSTSSFHSSMSINSADSSADSESFADREQSEPKPKKNRRFSINLADGIVSFLFFFFFFFF